ncbi:hypothetical protein niasHS_016150 [Heterodera schachtii]|uniref:Uncharacterized protein n=1 Tax=Heterodera schachtii TaxID=97005 RepID=A0ABD2IAZ9_HETSC
MHVNLLLLLATLLLMGECDGQKDSTNSGKVPTKTGKVPTKTGKLPKSSGEVPKSSGEVPKSSGEVTTKTGKVPTKNGNVPKSSGEVPTKTGKVPKSSGEVPKSSGEVPKKTGKVPAQMILAREPKTQIPSFSGGFIFLLLEKMRVIFVLLLATLLLIGECDGQKDSTNSGKVPTKTGKVPTKTGEMPRNSGELPTNHSAKKKGKAPNDSGKVPSDLGKMPTQIILDGSKKSARQNALNESLAYAVNFMAKRGKIPLESPRGEKENEPKAILIELITIYDNLQMDIEKAIKSWQKGDQKGKNGQKGKKENGQKGKEENGQKKQRFLQFVARSLEVKWDANAFSGGQENEDDGN